MPGYLKNIQSWRRSCGPVWGRSLSRLSQSDRLLTGTRLLHSFELLMCIVMLKTDLMSHVLQDVLLLSWFTVIGGSDHVVFNKLLLLETPVFHVTGSPRPPAAPPTAPSSHSPASFPCILVPPTWDVRRGGEEEAQRERSWGNRCVTKGDISDIR